MSFVAVVACVSPLTVSSQDHPDQDITLTTSRGSALHVPARGPLSNDSAVQVALDVVAIDRRLKPPKPGKHSGKAEVSAAMQQIAMDARNDAVDSLDLAYRVAAETSGVLDTGQIDSARQNVGIVKVVLNATPPDSLVVKTAISSTVAGASLHYWEAGAYKKKVGSWNSYTPGEPMHIGRYVFRLDSSTGEPYQELVLILADPTERVISPLHE